MSLRTHLPLILWCLAVPAAVEATSVRGLGTGYEHVCVLTSAGEVQCWGGNDFGQLGDGTTTGRTTPGDVLGLPSGIVALGVGLCHACAVTRGGGVQCWGRNEYGQLGDSSTTDRLTPTDVSGLASGVIAVTAGWFHTCALTAAGGVKCWGSNGAGRVGDGTTTDRWTPVDVSGLTAGVAAVAAGWHHTCAVTTAGGVKCWGANGYGQLGDGTTADRWTPVDVSGLTAGVAAVAAGEVHTCAVTSAGGLRCWGCNLVGQLGDGTTIDRSTPAWVGGMSSGVAAVAAGSGHTCAVLGTGALRCWGWNLRGEVGDGTVTDRWTPVTVSGLASGVAAAAGGLHHTCALLSNGGVRCWGNNASGQLGDGTKNTHWTPATVSGLTGGGALSAPGATHVAVGAGHACAVSSAGGVQCWGTNSYGQLGDGTTIDRKSPVAVRGLASGVASVTVGSYHSCALTTSGGVKCWGRNTYGQLGDSSTTDRLTPTDVSGLAAWSVAAGVFHTCALTTLGGVKCWGHNGYGQLGDGTGTNRSTPAYVIGLGSYVTAVSAGSSHTCALLTSGGLRCWGYNVLGQLGDGTTTNRSTPVWVTGLSGGVVVVAVAGGDYHTCAITVEGGARCWGYNAYGQVGDGTTTALRTTPVAVSGLTSDVIAIAAGGLHTCALAAGGRAQCWGDNQHGTLGDGTSTDRSTPVVVSGLMAGAASVSAGGSVSCVVTSRGGVQCWGRNHHGQLGDGTTTDRSKPGWVTGLVGSAGAVSAGTDHSCRVTAAAGVQCWGANSNGQVGDGTTTERRTPVDVTGLASGVVAVSAGYAYACALTSAGAVKCWGANGSGQLGDGTTVDRTTPTYVTGLTSGVAGLALGAFHTCALTAAGGVLCWGYNGSGQLGNGTTTDRSTPAWVSGLRSGVRAVTAGWSHTCALTAAGAVTCWGHNLYGQLGDGTATWREEPTAVGGLTSGVVDLDAASYGTCAVVSGVGVRCWGTNPRGQLGDGTKTSRSTPVAVLGLASEAATIAAGSDHTCAVTAAAVITCWGDGWHGQLGNGTTTDRLTPTAVRGFKLDDDYDSDLKADIAVYRPSSGTWFSLDSTTGNTSYQYRGWGVQASGDVPVSGCDFDRDGIVDPTVFRPSAGTWFILKSGAGFTKWAYFGWGTTGDVPVPADYDGDGITDAAVYRPSEGKWYVRPSGGGTQWNVGFGNATDVPIPGYYDADGKADIAVYRPATGTWFILTSSSGYTSYWYKGWGVQASGDTPAPGDYDGDGRMDLCVFRAATGTWFILESHASFTTWNYYGWGANGDTVVPSDYDGDGITDAAVYRPSNYTWYVRPSSGASQWSVVFGAAGDVPLITIR